MSDDRCPEHNCDIAACFGEHQGGAVDEAFEKACMQEAAWCEHVRQFSHRGCDCPMCSVVRKLVQAAEAHLREPMACGHPRACLRGIPLTGTVKEDEVHGCLICEIERIHDEAMDLANKERDEAVKKAHALPQGRA